MNDKQRLQKAGWKIISNPTKTPTDFQWRHPVFEDVQFSTAEAISRHDNVEIAFSLLPCDDDALAARRRSSGCLWDYPGAGSAQYRDREQRGHSRRYRPGLGEGDGVGGKRHVLE